MKTRTLSLAKLTPASYNPRNIDDEAMAGLRASISRFGLVQPIVWNERTGNVVGGHQRMKVLLADGVEETDVIVVDLDDQDERALNVAMNNPAISGEFTDELQDLLGEIRGWDEDVFSDLRLDRLLLDEVPAWETPEDGDAVPDAPEEAVSEAGAIYTLGKHRVMCGDSTSADDVKLLMDGALAQMVFTDPPYGVNYTGGAKKRENLEGDHVGTDIYAASLCHLRDVADAQAALYLWYADGHAAAAAAAAAGYSIVAQVIWAKNHAQFVTSAHYKGKHEPCYYAHRKGKGARWHGPNNEVTLWECDRAPRNDFHPTQKPVELACRAMRNSSAEGHIILDLFLGGGTTVVAAESGNRICYGMEIEPRYVDVVRRRWAEFVHGAECDWQALTPEV